MPKLFGVALPQITKFRLRDSLNKLKTDSRTVLYFYYSEFLIRANRNPWYKYTLNSADITAIDGKGLHWSMWRLIQSSFLSKFYHSMILPLPYPFRVLGFLLMFPIQFVSNVVGSSLRIMTRYNFTLETKNEVILGRDFVYDLLKIAQQKNWKTLVLGGSSVSDELTKELINKLFPGIQLITWNREFNSLLMRDQINPGMEDEILNFTNVCQLFPDLWEAKKYIKEQKPDLIIICLGGGSGKQEFFIENLRRDKEITFTLATGLGAAVDHLGGGSQQPLAPNWLIKSGLEWLFRFIMVPRRRLRIIDSLFTLWWWTTVEEFMKDNRVRKTVVNIVYRHAATGGREFLLVKRRNVLPGDVGWTFVQGGMSEKEGIYTAGIRELKEEVKINSVDCIQIISPCTGAKEDYTVSFLRYLVHGCQYSSSQNYLNFVEYSSPSDGQVNWENDSLAWVPESEVESQLSIEKIRDWEIAQSMLV